jgi:hypothetical protein
MSHTIASRQTTRQAEFGLSFLHVTITATAAAQSLPLTGTITVTSFDNVRLGLVNTIPPKTLLPACAVQAAQVDWTVPPNPIVPGVSAFDIVADPLPAFRSVPKKTVVLAILAAPAFAQSIGVTVIDNVRLSAVNLSPPQPSTPQNTCTLQAELFDTAPVVTKRGPSACSATPRMLLG